MCVYLCVCFSYVRPALCLGIAMFEDRIEGANLLSVFFFFSFCACVFVVSRHLQHDGCVFFAIFSAIFKLLRCF